MKAYENGYDLKGLNNIRSLSFTAMLEESRHSDCYLTLGLSRN